MDAKRALPFERPFLGLWIKYEHELGSEFRCWPDVFADDAVADAGVDLCGLCGCLRRWLGGHLVYLSRDQGVEFGGDGGATR